MDRTSLAFARVIFFVMLFVSTACNKIDRSLLKEDLAAGSGAAASAQASDSARLQELEMRVHSLEAELKAVNTSARLASDIPGGVTWD